MNSAYPGFRRLAFIVWDKHSHKPLGFTQLEMMSGCLMDQHFFLIMTRLGLRPFEPVMGIWKMDEEMTVLAQFLIPNAIVNRVVPMLALFENLSRVP